MSREQVWRLELPYSTAPLSLNDRYGWQVRWRISTKVKSDVVKLVRAAKIPALGRVHVEMFFRPSTNRFRDVDNLVATLKPCNDGIRAAGVVVDDDPRFLTWSPPVLVPWERGKPGAMWLILTDRSTEK